jgi:dTDP-glucose 4,6-dehydratase
MGQQKKPALETDCPNPTSPYAISKLAADLHVLSCYKHIGFPANVIRPSNCYGPTQLMYRIIPKAILYSLNNYKFPLEGGGTAKKSFMHAADLANCIYEILHSKYVGQIFNAGVDKPVTMKNIIEIIARNTNKELSDLIKVTPPRKSEDKQYWVNSNKAKKLLKWEPKVSLEEGIIDCIDWVKKFNKELLNESNEFSLRA